MHRMQGMPSSRMRAMRACSGAPTWGMGSTSSSAQSTSERLEVTTFTIYSPRAERDLWRPGVSSRMYWVSSRFTTP